MRRLFGIIIFCFITVLSFAQDMEVNIEAPRVVAVGESFRVEFTMNQKPVNFTPPSFEGFDLLAGPSISQSNRIYIVNGKKTQSSTHSYSYVLVANEKGNFNINPAEATFDGKSYKSKTLPIEVVEGGTQRGQATGGSSGTVGISKDDILLVMSVDKTNAYKGEAIYATVKLLTKVQIAGVEGAKTPSFAGFWQQELNNNRQITDWTRVNHNDNIYESVVVKEFLLFPQQDGIIKIDPMTMNVVVRVADNSNSSSGDSMFDSFFGGGVRYRDIRKVLSTKAININVKPYVGVTPSSFSGAVGEFTLVSNISSTDITANSSSNIILTIKGNGNLPLITEPILSLPTSFELYKVKGEESINVTPNGVSGQKTFTYPFIARAQGEYKLDPVEFTYFSPRNGKFVTIRSDVFNMVVSADNSISGNSSNEPIISGVSKEELKILSKDIRYIATTPPALKPKGKFLIWSSTYFAIIAVLLVVCTIVLLILRQIIKDAKDTVKVKSKRANKVALSRLKEAKRHLDNGMSGDLYEAIMKAMWGYVADKLDINKASLSRDKVGEQLSNKGIDAAQIEQFISVISSCEEARYSPVASSMMSEVYNSAIEVITKFENKL